MQMDIRAKLHFYEPGKSRRKGPILPPAFNCIFEIEHQSFDCRLLEISKPIELGETVVLWMQFLWPELVLPKLTIGGTFFLWEHGHIADGEVVEIIEKTGLHANKHA